MKRRRAINQSGMTKARTNSRKPADVGSRRKVAKVIKKGGCCGRKS